MASRANDLDEVVRCHVRGHADGDTTGTVDEQAGEGGGHHARLRQLVVIVGNEVDGFFVEAVGHQHRGWGEPGLGVSSCCRSVVQRPEVPVTVHERHAHREGLRHAYERVIDGAVAVRVVFAHHLADHTAALDVSTLC